ncbi:WD40/YVTN/BNR-like repeat-containing protein [Panacagrimonas sp.]|uniref:WD40/YVTN/BNR-like repeat-containing protein n=1 Tax=Panacagrimonas sp. TaxID=2480088 RepID=UPI003B529B81
MKRVLFAGMLAAAAVVTQAHAAAKSAEGRTQVLSADTPHDRLFSLIFEGDKGIAVGDAGLVKITTDGGQTWTRQEAPTPLAMIDVASNGRRTIAVGQMGLILVREGDGAWKKVESGTDRRLLRVDINQSGLAFIVGAFGTLLKSTDGGETWKDVAPNWAGLYDSGEGDTAVIRDEPTNYIVDVLDNGGTIIGGEYGQIMYSPDGGICWEIAYRHPAESGVNAPTLFASRIRPDGVGYAVGQAGLVVRTNNGGRTWAPLKTPTNGSLFGVESAHDGHVMVVGQRVALHSRDNGDTWRPVDALDLSLNWYTALGRGASMPAGEFIAVGHSGRVIRLAP